MDGRNCLTMSDSSERDMGSNWSKKAGHMGAIDGSKAIEGGEDLKAEILLIKNCKKFSHSTDDGTMGAQWGTDHKH